MSEELDARVAVLSEMRFGEVTDDSLAFLLASIDDPEPRIRDVAIDTLGSFGSCGQYGIENPAWRERVVVRLLRAFEDPEVFFVLQTVCYALDSFPDERAREPLARLLTADDPYLRARAGKALAHLGDERVLRPMRKLLRSAAFAAPETAAEALQQLGDRRAVSALIRALEQAKSEHLASSILYALGGLRDRRAAIAVITCLSHEVAHVRDAAIRALGDLGGKRAGRALRPLLRHADASVRADAARALGRARRGKRTLLRALTDPEPSVRWCVVEALGRFDAREAANAVVSALSDPDADVRSTAAEVLGTVRAHGRLAHERLVALFGDDSAEVRLAAVLAVGTHGWSCPHVQLEALLSDPDLSVALAAATMLAASENPPTREMLASRLLSPGLLRQADGGPRSGSAQPTGAKRTPEEAGPRAAGETPRESSDEGQPS